MITGSEPVTGLENQIGLTIRQYFAAMAMQGLCNELHNTNRPFPYKNDEGIIRIAKDSTRIADALITELNKKR